MDSNQQPTIDVMNVAAAPTSGLSMWLRVVRAATATTTVVGSIGCFVWVLSRAILGCAA